MTAVKPFSMGCTAKVLICAFAVIVETADTARAATQTADAAHASAQTADATHPSATQTADTAHPAARIVEPPPSSDTLTLNVPQLPSYGDQLVRMLTVLTLIVAGLLIVLLLLRRFTRRSAQPRSSGRIEVLDTLRLEPRRRVYLLRIGPRTVLIGSSEHGLHALGEPNQAAHGEQPPPAAFAELAAFAGVPPAPARPEPPPAALHVPLPPLQRGSNAG